MAVVAEERTRARRTSKRPQGGRGERFNIQLARRIDRKLRRYGESLDGALSVIARRRGMIDELRTAPFTLDFTAQGQRFTADVTPDPTGGFTAIVRGHEDCYTEGDTIDELRRALVEVTELVLFDMGTPVADEAIDF